MKRQKTLPANVLVFVFFFLFTWAPCFARTDPLPSWNDGPAKKSINEFVAKVTKEGSLDFAVWFRNRLYLFTSQKTLEQFVAAPKEFVISE